MKGNMVLKNKYTRMVHVKLTFMSNPSKKAVLHFCDNMCYYGIPAPFHAASITDPFISTVFFCNADAVY